MTRPTFHFAIQQLDTGKRTNDRGSKSNPDSKEERRKNKEKIKGDSSTHHGHGARSFDQRHPRGNLLGRDEEEQPRSEP